MRLSSCIKLAELIITLAFVAAVFFAWRADRHDRAQLQDQLAAAEKSIADLTSQQSTRDAQLQKALGQIAQQKQAVQTPAAALQALPAVLSLPSPIIQAPVPAPTAANAKNAPSGPAPVVIPPQDLKPLYDFASDCQACQAKLTAAQADLKDERAKSQVLERERDSALKAAKGGSIWSRIGRAAKWLAIGAAAGAIAAKAH
jgi:hypothetical protein